MDEIDKIIVHSLRQIGCDIKKDLISLSNFSPNLLVSTVAKCLSLINPSLENLPNALPHCLAQKVTVTNLIAEYCNLIGYRGDIGYQTFLYSNLSELRKLFMFLIEHLPKPGEPVIIAQEKECTSFSNTKVVNIMLKRLKDHWIPYCCSQILPTGNDISILCNIKSGYIVFTPVINFKLQQCIEQIHIPSKQFNCYWLHRSPSIFQQTTHKSLSATLIHKNDADIYYDGISTQFMLERNKKHVFAVYMTGKKLSSHILSRTNIKTFGFTTITKFLEIQEVLTKTEMTNINSKHKKIEIDLTQNCRHSFQSQAKEDHLKSVIDKKLLVRKSVQAKIQKLIEKRVSLDYGLKSLETARKVKERACLLLDDPGVNMVKIENLIVSSDERKSKVQHKWEVHQKSIILALKTTKAINSGSHDKLCSRETRYLRKKSMETTAEIKFRSILLLQLLNEYKVVDKTVSRKAFISKIMEIICNISKQKSVINRVLYDIIQLQKRISIVAGQLHRQFTVTDDLLFTAVKRYECSKKAYKLLVSLHSDCTYVVSLVRELGLVLRDIRDFEDQIELEKSRNDSINIENIDNDLNSILKECVNIQQKITAVKQIYDI